MKVLKSKTEPFGIIEENKKFKIVIANNLICDKEFKSKTDAEKYIESKPYDIIINLSFLAVDKAMQLTNNKQQKEEEKQ